MAGIKYDLSLFHAFLKPDNLYLAKLIAGIKQDLSRIQSRLIQEIAFKPQY